MTNEIVEEILDPELPIVDAHHHLWFIPESVLAEARKSRDEGGRMHCRIQEYRPRYLFDEFLADVTGGHNIRATVFVEAHSMYRTSGPEELRSVGEVEFAAGMAAIADSGAFGDVRICAAIVGSIDLRLGTAIPRILEAHLAAGGGRYRAVRPSGIVYDEELVGTPHVMLDPQFRAGLRHLGEYGLPCEIFAFETQLAEFYDLVAAFPKIRFVLNHVGTPIQSARFDETRDERFSAWRRDIQALSHFGNITVKLGGLGMPFQPVTARATSQALACRWRPYIETCIEAFGADRCMFESNYPVDGPTADYSVIWNAFKRIARGASPSEKQALFSATAADFYQLGPLAASAAA